MKYLFRAFVCIMMAMLLSVLSADAQTITMKKTNVSVQEAITYLGLEGNYTVVMKTSSVDMTKKVNVDVKDAPIMTVLSQIFEGQDVEFAINGHNIVVSKAAPKQADPKPAAHKPVTVKGVVTDSQGNPLAGAFVVISGTSNGTMTDIDGHYEISVPVVPSTLEYSFVGMNTATLKVSEKQSGPLNVSLENSSNFIEETVVVGYATMKKRNLVGAVDMVTSEMLESRPTANIATSLQGAVPGLNISFIDSKPSRSATMDVRGTSSIGSGGSALVLIDGVEGKLNEINPQDIASVSVLKDASSAAVYGARGAFGVILVTTKNAKKGTPVIQYDGSVSIHRRTVIYDFVTDALTWVNWWQDAFNGYYNGSKSLPDHFDSTAPFTQAIYDGLVARKDDPTLPQVTSLSGHSQFGWAYYANTDWFDLFYKDYNLSQQHNLSVSGGNDNADYYVSARYYGQDGIYRVGNEKFRKYDIRAKGTLKVRPWLKITNNMSIAITDQHEPKHSRDNFAVQRAMNHAALPISPVYNPDGTWTTAAAISGYAAFSEGTSYRDNDYVYLREKISADIDILPEVLKLSADYSFNYTSRKRVDVQTMIKYCKTPGVYLYESESAGTSRKEVHYDTRYHAANAYLSWSPKLGKNHDLTALLGWNLEQRVYKTTTVSKNDFITNTKQDSFNLMNGVSVSPTSGGNEWAYVGVFYRLNYALFNRYLFEVSGRYDGSSKFPNNSQWGFFPSASFAWRISDEKWMDWSNDWLSNAKFRVSAGSMGNGNVDPYSYVSEMAISTASDYVLDGGYPMYTTVAADVPVSLTWEKSSTYDLGLDMDFLDSRLSFSGDYYWRITSNMYTQSVELPAVYGASSPKGNNAELLTRGWELSLQWRDQFNAGGKPFHYSIKGSVWDSRSFVTKFATQTGSLGTIKGIIGNNGSPSSYYVGMEIGEVWGYTVEGLFKDYEDIANSAKHNFKQTVDNTVYPGQVKFKDMDGNKVIDAGNLRIDDHGDLSIIGNQLPHYKFGLNLSASWNGIGLTLFLQGVGKRDWYPGADAGYFWGKYGRPFFAAIPTIHTDPDQVYTEYADGTSNWDTAYWPRKTTYQSNGSNNLKTVLETPNTRYIQNAAYVRLKNLQLDYSFPKHICQAVKMEGIKLYFSGENLLTFTPLHKHAPNFDPEGLSFDTDYDDAGDGYTYPTLKSFTFGLNLTF